jgi:hypothetical protein
MTLKLSLADKWVKCPAYNHSQQQSNNVYASEGTQLHKQAEEFLKNFKPCDNDKIKVYVDFVNSLIVNAFLYGIEDKVYVPNIHPEINYGKVDFWSYDLENNMLNIVDLKTGFRDVSPVESWQMIAYAVGLRKHLIDAGALQKPESLKINLIIVQPPSYNDKVKSWIFDCKKLDEFLTILKDAAHNAYKENPVRKSGMHCVYCDNRSTCLTMNTMLQLCADLCSIEGFIENYSIKEKINFLDSVKKLIESCLTAETEKAIDKLKNKEVLQGLSLKESSSVDWKDDERTAAFLDFYDLYKDRKACTVKQAIAAGIPESLINQFVDKKTIYKLKVN